MTAGRAAEGSVTVFLLDDHELVRRGLREFLGEEGDLEIVGEAGTATDALAAIEAARPDVAIIDVRLPDGNGIEVCREVRSRLPDTKCLILTSFADEEALFDAVVAGASGYVLKETKTSELVRDIRKLAAGESLIDPALKKEVLSRAGARAGSGAGLSPQEERILELIGEGLTNRQIGERLHLAEQTVKNYVSRLMSKLGFERRVQAALYATRKQR
ncbi:MAG: response regulator transcription factor [Actinobacteria bacterium]|nr:response regulator transcription factor [Actinomycetota bacterium]